jgi:hypothetical protein
MHHQLACMVFGCLCGFYKVYKILEKKFDLNFKRKVVLKEV